MYKPTEKQPDLFGAASELSEAARRRLEATWAEGFRREIWPILLEAEDDFSDLYDQETGRGCWSIARKLGMMILQEWHGLTDTQVVDRLSFDLRFQYALMLRTEKAYLSRQGLSDFRRRLVEADPEMKRLRGLMGDVVEAMVEQLDIDLSEQRTDSTRVTSNIRVRGRVDLFVKTLTYVDGCIAKRWPHLRDRYSQGLREWLDEEPEGWFGGATDEEYRVKLEQLVDWTLEMAECLEAEPETHGEEPFDLLVQLLEEHCEIEGPGLDNEEPVSPDDDGQTGASRASQPGTSQSVDETSDQDRTGSEPSSDGGEDSQARAGTDTKEEDASPTRQVTVKKSPDGGCDGLQSPYDPDAGYTEHKGVGYDVHITESCRNGEETPEVIVDVEVTSANVDTGKLSGIVARLDRQGLAPKTIYADAGYGTGTELNTIRQYGVEPMVPVPRGNQSELRKGREQFELGEGAKRVLRCPAGHKPYAHSKRYSGSKRTGEKTPHARFYSTHCRNCPAFKQCPTRPPDSGKGGYVVEIRPGLVARDARLAEQKTDSFQDAYSIRSGSEATISELNRAHDLDELRIRREPKVRMKAMLKAIACNTKRWTKRLTDEKKESLRRLCAVFFAIWTAISRWLGLSPPIADRRAFLTH